MAQNAAGYRYPIASDANNYPLHIQNLADDAAALALQRTGGSLTGPLDLTGQELRQALVGVGLDKVRSLPTATGAVTVDATAGPVHDLTLTGDVTITLAGAVTGRATRVAVLLRQGATVRAVTWPASVTWMTGPPVFVASSTTRVDLLTVDGGTSWIGVSADAGGLLRRDGSRPMTGTLDMAGQRLDNANLRRYGEPQYANFSASGTITLDLAVAGAFRLGATGDLTLVVAGLRPAVPVSALSLVIGAGPAARTITWPPGTVFPNGVNPSPLVANTLNVFTLWTDNAGTDWFCFAALDFR